MSTDAGDPWRFDQARPQARLADYLGTEEYLHRQAAGAASASMTGVARPTGGAWLAIAWVALIGGTLGALAGILFPEEALSYGARLIVLGLAAGLFQLGLLALVTGSIVRAIFFLPGRDVTEADLER